MSKTYKNDDTFTHLNEIKRLSEEIRLSDILNPDKDCVAKIIELVSRGRCLKEFEILTDGDLLYEQRFGDDVPGVGKIRC